MQGYCDALLLYSQLHGLVGDPGFLEHVADRFEAETPVEGNHADLGVQKHAADATLARQAQCSLHERTSDAQTAIFRQYRHASETPVVQQPGGTHCIAARHLGQQVHGLRVPAVPFEVLGHTLLLDEDPCADRANGRLVLWPIDLSDVKLRVVIGIFQIDRAWSAALPM
jgi:hypothetical protein